MLDILFCTLGYPPEPAGGAEHQARLLAEALVRHGHRVTVVSRSMAGSRTERVGGVTVHRLAAGRRAPARQAYYARLAAHLATTVRRFDLVHVHHANVQADIVVPIAAAAGRPVYLKVAGGGPSSELARQHGIRRWTAARAFRGAAAVQAQSADAVARLGQLGVRSDRIVTIPNGLDPAAFRPPTAAERVAARVALGLPVAGTIVLSTGRFAVEKGTADLLAAWDRLTPGPEATLLLVGQPADRHGVHPVPSDGIVVRPWTTDPAPYLRAADVFVLPSHGEGMSNALLEALASGLPAIVTPVGAGPALVTSTGAGLVVPVGDVPALVTALDAMLTDGDLRGRLAAAGPAAVADLDIDAVATRIEAVYDQMVATV